jgi:hypothetical protein
MAGKSIDDYIEGLGDWRGDAVRQLRSVIDGAAPDATSSIKWAQPVWESNGPFVYVKAFPASVNVGFWRGADLADPDDLLEGDGDRMKHMKLRSATDVRSDAVAGFVREAVALNERLGNPTKRG